LKFLTTLFSDLFTRGRFYLSLGILVVLFIIAFYIPVIETAVVGLFIIWIILCLADLLLLFTASNSCSAKRITLNRLSNGDDNKVQIIITNGFSFDVNVEIMDELPVQLQVRDWSRKIRMKAASQQKIVYFIKPKERGEYEFGNIHLFVSTPLKLLCRRFTSHQQKTVPVYPAYFHLQKYGLFTDAIIKNETGSRRMRKMGQSMEFEQIKEYVSGDDIRTLNWKASARRGTLMVNNFTDERSQQIYCIIDKGRLMKMPFDGMTLLDYAINSCLVLSNVCLQKQDRTGLITFSNLPGTILPADRKPIQSENIMQALYKQDTDFLESDFEMLYQLVRNKINRRSMLILFTNFESLSGLNRQIEYLRAIAKHHLLLIVFFENTEQTKLASAPAKNIEEVYIKTAAAKFAYEKRLIVKELSRFGIAAIHSTPKKLTVNAINKYLELKSRQAI
jgi:uncharacterized protein (DUF58 family)